MMRLDKQKMSGRTQSFIDCRGLSPDDDYLASVKRSLGLPEDTPEPLVGLIWRLEQRIEDLDEMQMPSILKDRGVAVQ